MTAPQQDEDTPPNYRAWQCRIITISAEPMLSQRENSLQPDELAALTNLKKLALEGDVRQALSQPIYLSPAYKKQKGPIIFTLEQTLADNAVTTSQESNRAQSAEPTSKGMTIESFFKQNLVLPEDGEVTITLTPKTEAQPRETTGSVHKIIVNDVSIQVGTPKLYLNPAELSECDNLTAQKEGALRTKLEKRSAALRTSVETQGRQLIRANRHSLFEALKGQEPLKVTLRSNRTRSKSTLPAALKRALQQVKLPKEGSVVLDLAFRKSEWVLSIKTLTANWIPVDPANIQAVQEQLPTILNGCSDIPKGTYTGLAIRREE